MESYSQSLTLKAMDLFVSILTEIRQDLSKMTYDLEWAASGRTDSALEALSKIRQVQAKIDMYINSTLGADEEG